MKLNMIPIVGWLMSTAFLGSASVPFWYVWTHCGLGVRYFYFLPEVFQSIPFWHVVGLFIIIWTLRSMIPQLATINNSAKTS